MSPIELAGRLHFNVVNAGDGEQREIQGIYCCDLLSVVMGRAQADSAWITVMGNINSIAVAVLSDVSCIILSEHMQLDAAALEKAQSQNVCVLASDLPTYEISREISNCLGL